MDVCGSKSPRYANITELPLDIQTMLLKLLSYKELAMLRKVSTHFACLIESEFGSLVNNLSTPSLFPNSQTVEAMSWLSSQGNIEASIKLGIAHLYREGLRDTVASRQQNSTYAAEYFCAMEKNRQLRSPITWIFVRPPWSNATICRKALVMKHFMKLIAEGDTHPHLYYCIGKLFTMFEDIVPPGGMKAENYFQFAAEAGLPHAMYELWKMELQFSCSRRSLESVFSSLEPGNRLAMMRKLRQIATTGYKPAQIQLGRLYAIYQSCEWTQCPTKQFCGILLGSSCPRPIKPLAFTQSSITSDMRLILVDWLIEVANLKDFSSETLHATVNCVDRYLRMRELCKTRLQLLGIACMVIFARKMEKEVLTIRESIWLTDSSYTYEEMVQMIEDVVSTMKGDLEDISSRDCLSVLLQLKCIDPKAKYISEFITDAVLLHDDLRTFSPSITASACLFLAMISVDPLTHWDTNLISFTDFSKHDIVKPVEEIHKYCFLHNGTSSDPRLSHVQERYNKAAYGETGIAGQIITSVELASCIKDDATEVLIDEKDLPDLQEYAYYTEVSSTSSEEQGHGYSQQPSYAHTMDNPSSDDDFEADTPPTLSCVFLIHTDTKARKRIQNSAHTNRSSLQVQENVVRMEGFPRKSTASKDKAATTGCGKSPRPNPVLEKENAGKRSNSSRDHSVSNERAQSTKSMRKMR